MNQLDFLSEAENKQRDKIIKELNDAFQQRLTNYAEFDDMTYDQWYVANKKAASGYIRPKKNRQDLRTVTGTTREKCNTVVAALLRYNFDFNIDAYDSKDWPDRNLGFGMEGLVRKSRLLELPTYEEKRALIYGEFVAQGNVFLFEANVEEEELCKEITNNSIEDVMKIKWKEKKKVTKRCEVDMIPGINVYLGNIREYYMDKQPYVGIRRELTRSEVDGLYGAWPRYAKLKEALDHENQVLNDKGGQTYNNWQMLNPEKDFVEEIRYYNVRENTYQIMVNGIPMLPVGFPLEYLLGVRKYPIIKANGEPISRNFAYCRGVAVKNKFNQAILDEFLRIIVLKFRKSTNPPMANLTGKMLNRSIFDSGSIHQGVDPEKLKQIGDNQAVTGAEFNVFQLVKQAIDESSVSPTFEGNRTPGEKTAKEVQDLKSQSLMKLGMIMVGIIQMEEQLIWLRLYNILKNCTAPIDTVLEETKEGIKKKNIYRNESVESSFEDGQKGVHMIEMSEEMPEPEQIYAEEKYLTRRKGVEIRKTYLNPKELASLKYRFFIKVTPIEQDHSELEAAMFEESMSQAFGLFPDAVNKPYWMDTWANYKKLDPRKAFVKNAPTPPPMAEAMGAKTVGAQALPQVKQQMKPSLKRMM